ncbi:MAG TPA: caspase family protein [Candidatus Thermoplasmatota archaeon]|nr:caspase family protein [Candidatus Thermoplasmatota archaeon]
MKKIPLLATLGSVTLFMGIALMPSVFSAQQPSYQIMDTISTERSSILAPSSSTKYFAVIAACSKYNNSEYNLPKKFLPPFSDKKLSVLYASLVQSGNWNESNIILLLNDHATKRNITDALVHMAESVGPDDIFLFSWCGHGTEVNDSDGDESSGGVNDTTDEAICPYDVVKVDNYTKLNVLTDDELGRLFSNITCKGMCLVFDCCLSGDMVDRETNQTAGDSRTCSIDSSFTTGFCADLTGPKATDVNGNNRVILMSARPGLLERGIYLTGFPLEFGLAYACSHAKLSDRNRDGMISAEEAFGIARPLEYIQSTIFWISCWPYLYLYYSLFGIHSPLFALIMVPIEYILAQLVMKAMDGHYFGNFPFMQDTYEGQLPLIQE